MPYNRRMNKPSWNILKRKYDLGYNAGHKAGYDEGFMSGSKKALTEARKVFIKLIQEEIKEVSNPMLVDKEYIDGLERAMDFIKKGK